jgi:hypothetical protein
VHKVEKTGHGHAIARALAHERDTGGPAARIKLDPHGLEFAGSGVTVDEPDDEGRKPVHACAATPEQ